jgi:hypothetical protein
MDPSTKISGNCVNALPAPPPPRRLLDQLSDRIRFKHYSIRTEQAYCGWVRRFILFHNKRHPREMGGTRGRGVSYSPCGRGACFGIDSEPGEERLAIPLQGGAGGRAAVAG